MKHSYNLRIILLFFVAVIVFPVDLAAQIQSQGTVSSVDYVHESEEFWASINFIKLKNEIGQSLQISGAELDLFDQYLQSFIDEDAIYFFGDAPYGRILPSDYAAYLIKMKQKYIGLYPTFINVKAQFSAELASNNNKAQAANGPCTNIGFESGNLTGWTTKTGTACGTGNCTLATTTNPGCRVQITNKTMTDPLIATLPTVFPGGGNNSVRIENFQNGKGQSSISQTFLVTATNNVFTYNYAVVLEDPITGHNDTERPFFEVRMYDGAGQEITCATYKRFASAAQLPDFIYNPVPFPTGTASGGCSLANNNGNGGGTGNMELYYKPWSTVSIPLLNYIGQNVTIVFTAGDCSKGAHLGYAYVDASCSMMNPLTGTIICGTQNVDFTATPGFSSWAWQRLAPSPASVGTTESVTLNQPGSYSLTMQPFTNNNVVCPTVQNFTIAEHCTQTITHTYCDNPKGSGTITAVNLNTYNTEILNYNTAYAKTLVSWHSGYPITTANRVSIVPAATNLTVVNGAKYYAYITYNSPIAGSDTAVLNFIINSSPVLTFPAVGPLCVGSAAVTLSATPTGGTYSGTGLINGNQFNPTASGSFVITYSYTNPTTGCSNTITQTILVQPPPTVNAGPDQTVCGNVTSVALSGSATNTTSVLWTTNSTQGGTLSPTNASSATYTPGANEKANGATITMTLRANGASSCPFVTDQVIITIVPQVTVNAGIDQTLCAPTSFALTGTSINTTGVAWTVTGGGNGGTISSAASPNATYNTSPAERTGGATITLTFTGTAVSPCPTVTDQVILKVVPVATVNAGPDQTVCAAAVALAGTAANYTSVAWTPATGIASATSLSTVYTPSGPSATTLTLTAFANAPCPNVTDQITLTISPTATVNAGPDKTYCASVAATIALSGTATNAAGGTTWTRNGVAISTNPNSLNTTYSPTAAELASGATITFTLTAAAAVPCPAVSDQVIITIIPVATVNAGPDQLICASTGSFALTGTVTNVAGGVKWTSNGGGTIISPNSLNATYLPLDSEKSSGATITMTLTATPASPCTPVQDQVVLTISPVATVEAGVDQLICATTTSLSLSGTATNAAGGVTWTSTGNGTIAGINSLNTIYTPSSAELLSGGTITMTLTATPASPCPIIMDQLIITIIPLATVNAGIDRTICASSGIVSLSGAATNQTKVAWTGGSGIFAPVNSLNTIYIPTSSEISSGATITVTLTATATSPCTPVTDQAVITIVPIATVEAGIDHSICTSTTSVFLSGSSSNGASVAWTSNGSGTLSSASTESTTYNLSASEIISGGSITLTLTVTANSPCPPSSDQTVITIIPQPKADAGPDQHVCADTGFVTLSGSVTNAMGGTWSLGEGNYNPGNQTLNAIYTASEGEKAAGVATLVLTTTNDPLCAPATDIMDIFIHPLPVVNIGPDQKLCPESDPPAIFNAGPGAAFLWQPTGETTQFIAVSAAGTYTVKVTTAFGCASPASANVTEVCPPRLFISNSFTPNADKNNDDYNVYGAHFTNFHMFIFNRWGEIIFESKDRNLVWDGIYRGEPMPIGVYPWIITYTGDSEEYYGPYRVEGSVTLVR